MRIIHPREHGLAVRDIQHRLLGLGYSIEVDELEGWFGPSTEAAVRALQQRRGVPADGVVGPDTWSQLVEAGYRLGDRTLYLRYPSFRGDDVASLQRLLNALGFDAGREDGILGEQTAHAVQDFQRNVGHEADGIVGPDTLAALERLRPPVQGPSRAVVREAEAIRRMDSSLHGAVVAIDPGHGPGDPGGRGPRGLTEADAAMDIATLLADLLDELGAKPKLLRGRMENPDASIRARVANDLGAALCVSLHLNVGDPGAEGATCFYFGTDSTHSPAGRRLAEVIQSELSSRLGLMDGRIHPLQVAILRETRMPAVQVEPCFVTNAREELLLADASFRADVAAAVAAGIERFFRAAEADRGHPAVAR